MADNSTVDTVSKSVQVISIVIGVVISVMSFNHTRQKDADARLAEAKAREFEMEKYYAQRKDEADKQEIEAAKPFLELRQKRYMEAVQTAAVLSSPEEHTADEIQKARKRFWELYWAELSMVEDANIEVAMIKMGNSLNPDLNPTPQQNAAYGLAHALRDSLTKSWGVSEKKEGKINP